LFDSVLKAIASLIRWASRDYPDFFVMVSNLFPSLVDLNPFPSYHHIYIRRLMKFIGKLFVYGTEELLANCETILPFCMRHLKESSDETIREIVLTSLIAVSSRSDNFSSALIKLGFLDCINHTQSSLNRGHICSILRNFAAAEDGNVIASLLTDTPMSFLLCLVEHGAFQLKQKAWLVLCYLIQVQFDTILPIFEAEPQYFESLAQVLTANSDPDFIEAVVFALRRLFDAEENLAAKRGSVNPAAALFSDTGLLVSLADLRRVNGRLGEVVTSLVTDIEGALSLDMSHVSYA
jgi:hypothetical protein